MIAEGKKRVTTCNLHCGRAYRELFAVRSASMEYALCTHYCPVGFRGLCYIVASYKRYPDNHSLKTWSFASLADLLSSNKREKETHYTGQSEPTSTISLSIGSLLWLSYKDEHSNGGRGGVHNNFCQCFSGEKVLHPSVSFPFSPFCKAHMRDQGQLPGIPLSSAFLSEVLSKP